MLRLTSILCALWAASLVVSPVTADSRAPHFKLAAQEEPASEDNETVAGPSRITILPAPGARKPEASPQTKPESKSKSKPSVATLTPPDSPEETKILTVEPAKPQAKSQAKPQLKTKAARPDPAPRERVRERAPERVEKAREEKARERLRPNVRENFSRRPVASRAICPAGSSPMTQGSRMCCETTPERGAPRIFCP
jgi:hypothetical protein